ncbi:MAG: DUF4384 domain-containing protein [Magnetococcales bacterium]|nr:DUF4384 domain-containing protein [Magnetococcales bacterium]
MVHQIVREGGLTNKAILVSGLNFYDSETELSLPLAKPLREKAIAELRAQNVQVLLPGAGQMDNMLELQCTWQQEADNLRLFMKVLSLSGDNNPKVVYATDGIINHTDVDPKLLVPDMDSWARYLVQRLNRNYSKFKSVTVNLIPVSISGRDDPGELGEYLTDWLRPAMAESGVFNPSDQAGSESDLAGKAYIHRKQLEIRLHIRDRMGNQLSAASAKVPRSLFPSSLFLNSAAMRTSRTTTTLRKSREHALDLSFLYKSPGEKKNRKLPKDKQSLTMMSEDMYRIGFIPNEQAYVYIFQIDSLGQIYRLFPTSTVISLEGKGQNPVSSGKEIFLPHRNKYYSLDNNIGGEKLFIIVSHQPEADLEIDIDNSKKRQQVINTLKRKSLAVNRHRICDGCAYLIGIDHR